MTKMKAQNIYHLVDIKEINPRCTIAIIQEIIYGEL